MGVVKEIIVWVIVLFIIRWFLNNVVCYSNWMKGSGFIEWYSGGLVYGRCLFF